MLDAAKQPLYKGCRDGHSPLSSASRLMAIKPDLIWLKNVWMRLLILWDMFYLKIILHMVHITRFKNWSLVLIYRIRCQMYASITAWFTEEHMRNLKNFNSVENFNYQDTSERVSVPYKLMWYFPLTERLKRLYQSERKTWPMRWHADHSINGEKTHRSDAKVCKNFQST